MRKIGVMTSGGDSPGMNAAIRSIVRKSIYEGLQVVGIMRGYEGLIDGELINMDSRSVSNILGLGGTILKTARSERFMTEEGQKQAVEVIKKNDIDALIIIGGNGSLQGAHILHEKWGIPNIGLPGTIDNDLGHTDYTIGSHTSVHTVLDAVDKIRDTVSSMERIYVVEVMGRKEPYIAINAGLACGAEEILYPGKKHSLEDMAREIRDAEKKGKRSWIIIVSEGYGHAPELSEWIKTNTGFSARAVVLGHIQRGGSPLAPDRILASTMGARAVEAVLQGDSDKMVAVRARSLFLVSYQQTCFERDKDREFYRQAYALTKLLAT
ncbi:MAG: 6-phosphofructokinase [Candidatus Omnitrophica bacterium]|nr:6-phosphofructokinase [Candidatus Omnitrophota bacterium]